MRLEVPGGSVADSAEVERVVVFFEQLAAEEGSQPGGELHADGVRTTYFALWTYDGEVKDGASMPTLEGGLQLVRPDMDWALPNARVWRNSRAWHLASMPTWL